MGNIREIIVRYAEKFIGTPYIWGGDDPSGFDCSGLVIEVLKGVGVLPRSGDWTADSLRKILVSATEPRKGNIVFYWNRGRNKVVHTEICFNDDLTIGSSGGGAETTTEEAAWRQNAYIKLRPINYSRGFVTFAKPQIRE